LVAYGSAAVAGTTAAAADAAGQPRVVPAGYPRVRSVTEVEQSNLSW